MEIPTKLTYKDLILSTTMFLINEDIDKFYEELIEKKILDFQAELANINSRTGIEAYIRKDKKSIDNILCLLDVAQEKFKRIVSLIRLRKGFFFESEWSNIRLRKAMLDDPQLMDDICTLFLDGVNSEKFKGIIPEFVLKSFQISIETMGRLANVDVLKILNKKDNETAYNKEIGSYFFSIVEKRVKEICNPMGLTIEKNVTYPPLKHVVGLYISDGEAKRLLINVSYNLTTSSGQSDWRKEIVENRELIKGNNNYMHVTIIDGAGWVGRQADAKAIHQNSNYCLNLNNLDKLEEIINFFFN